VAAAAQKQRFAVPLAYVVEQRVARDATEEERFPARAGSPDVGSLAIFSDQ